MSEAPVSLPAPGHEDHDRLPLILAVLTAVAVAARLFSLTFLHPLNWDEIEFFRATDWVRRGFVPFRDFWEHHTPLQWFVFAPFTALTSSPGAGAIIFMRWVQVPLWIGIFWLISIWMRDDGIRRFARWMAIVLAVSSSMLMLPAVEYRVDVLSCALYIGGLVLLQRNTAKSSFFAGVLFCLTGFANIRLGPLLALTVLINRVIDMPERRWRGRREANWVFAGVIAAFAAALLYFISTDSLIPLYQHVWVENYLGDKYAERIPWAFLHRILIPFGVRIYGGTGGFDLIGVDPAGSAIYILGFIGLVRALLQWRTPGSHFFLAVLQLSNLLFISVMKYVYHYHLEIVVLLMMPFVASEIDRLVHRVAWRRAALATATVFCVWGVSLVLLRGKEKDLAYQDLIMRQATALAAPGTTVFDGVGWAIRRDPAWRYWFLPELVRRLVEHKHMPPYGVEQFLANPPGAVITDRNAAVWIGRENPLLGTYIVRHYLPLWRNLLLPAMSSRIMPGQVASWIVPVDGRYSVAVAPKLASHEWFSHPLAYRADIHSRVTIEPGQANSVQWMRNGAPMDIEGDMIELKAGDRIAARSPHQVPVAVFLIPRAERVWFRQPPHGVTLDSEGVRVTHIPDFKALFSGRTPISSE